MGEFLMDSFVGSMFERGAISGMPLETVVLSLLLAFAIGHVIGWIYTWTHHGLSYSQSFSASLVVMPVLVCLVMLLMSDNLVVAFGLLAVFAVVRFRNVLKDTRDTTFILWSIIEGMACGILKFELAIVGAIVVALVIAYLRATVFGGRHRFDVVLSLQLTGDLVGGVASHRNILKRHSRRIHLATERRLTDEGLDLSYRLLLRDPERRDELLRALENSEGIQNVSLYMRDDESEF
ncbi:MAG: hypothetical protein CMJ40_03925 [Phycisphaerae bacterium]|nr:hypothetical protein [Phycisphaerae bacterium]|tara:strand:- start:593 stop:1300 length:708 start_codon:yes stop_codon:yes gene_type:complete